MTTRSLSHLSRFGVAIGALAILFVSAAGSVNGGPATLGSAYDAASKVQQPELAGPTSVSHSQFTRPAYGYEDPSLPARTNTFRASGFFAPQTADDLARLPVGRRGSPMDVPRANAPTTIGGRPYGAHALDEGTSEGFVPSVVEDAIQYGQASTGASGRIAYYSSANNVTVIVENGRVVTVSSGQLKIR